MSDCILCDVEHKCFYEYKPCECVQHRKFTPSTEVVNDFEEGASKNEIEIRVISP